MKNEQHDSRRGRQTCLVLNSTKQTRLLFSGNTTVVEDSENLYTAMTSLSCLVSAEEVITMHLHDL